LSAPDINIGAPEIFLIKKYLHRIYAEMVAASYSSDVLQTFYGPIPWQHKKGMKILTPSDILHTRIFQISEAIQNLPLEIREKIYKEFVAIKLKERKEMGWNEVLCEIDEAPFCEERARITRAMFCGYCSFCH